MDFYPTNTSKLGLRLSCSHIDSSPSYNPEKAEGGVAIWMSSHCWDAEKVVFIKPYGCLPTMGTPRWHGLLLA